MASEVRLPRLGQGMESGTIVRWLKVEGERVERGEPLYEVDTDKATQEVEAEESGVLLRIAVSAGEVAVGGTIALIGSEGEEVPEPAPAPADGAPADAGPLAAEPTVAPASPDGAGPDAAAVEASEPAAGADRVKASPLARRMARAAGVELAALRGSGPDGRVIAEDVERAARAGGVAAAAPAAAAEAGAEPESIPLTQLRKTIARRLGEAAQLPVFQLTVSADMTRAGALIEVARALEPDARVTVTDLLAKVCAAALRRHPELNARFSDEAILRFPSANIGLAVATPRGLVVPVIAAVERLSLLELAARRADLVARAREGRLAQGELEGGTFTISNLGMYGVEQFTAVLNPPQAAILAVGATSERPVVRAGALAVAPLVTLTLTVDHRAVDGGPAAEFLRTVKAFLEEPTLAL